MDFARSALVGPFARAADDGGVAGGAGARPEIFRAFGFLREQRGADRRAIASDDRAGSRMVKSDARDAGDNPRVGDSCQCSEHEQNAE